MYSSWDIARDACIYFSFWAIFSPPFTLLTAKKIKILKKWKNTWSYHHFTQLYQKPSSYAILFLRYGTCDRCNCFSFWTTFCPFSLPNNPKKQNFKKRKKTPEDIIILHELAKSRDMRAIRANVPKACQLLIVRANVPINVATWQRGKGMSIFQLGVPTCQDVPIF